MGTKAPSETKELRVVACDSLSNERLDRPPSRCGGGGMSEVHPNWARAGFGQLWGDHVEGSSAPFEGTERVLLAAGCCAEFLYKVEVGCPIRILGRTTPSLNLEMKDS